MIDKNDYTYEDNLDVENFEFSSLLGDYSQRQREPFMPIGGGNFPPIGNYPPEFSPPDIDYDNLPNFNYPGGNFNPPGMPKSPPPNYIPSKTDGGVQKLGFTGGPGGIQTQAVSGSSIRFCLYKYTYIWEESGRSYWAFLLNVSQRTVSGFRWFRRRWVYFGIDLRRIDSFVCYRSAGDSCESCVNIVPNNTSNQSSNTEYSLNGTRDVYTQTLASIDIPEIKEDFLTQTIAYFDDTTIKSQTPCVKARNIGYRINLEVTYPSDYDNDLKNKINSLASEAGSEILKIFVNSRSADDDSVSPLETYNSSLRLIPNALNTFSDSFNNKISQLDSLINNSNDITCSIRNEKIYSNWKPYFYNDSLY